MECWEIRVFKNDLEILVSLIEKYKVHILSLSGGDNPFFEQNKAIINNIIINIVILFFFFI